MHVRLNGDHNSLRKTKAEASRSENLPAPGCIGGRVDGVATYELKSPYVYPTLGFDINNI